MVVGHKIKDRKPNSQGSLVGHNVQHRERGPSTYAPRGRGGGGQASYTFLLRITCKKGGGGEVVQISCKIAYVINGWPKGVILGV